MINQEVLIDVFLDNSGALWHKGITYKALASHKLHLYPLIAYPVLNVTTGGQTGIDRDRWTVLVLDGPCPLPGCSTFVSQCESVMGNACSTLRSSAHAAFTTVVMVCVLDKLFLLLVIICC